ncbi:acid-sensing ion channel 4-B-like [Amblyomma americanum]
MHTLRFFSRRFSVCSDGVYLTPGYTTYVGLDVLAQTGLPAPYANPCRNSWPPPLLGYMDNMYGAYTREDCLNMCLQVKIVDKCKCLSAQLPHIRILTKKHGTCTSQKLECASEVSAIETNVKLEKECGCHRSCRDISYKRDVTITALREGISGQPKEHGPPARLVLYFNSLTYEQITSVPKYDEIRVLSNLGGISGMYLGLSFFVLFQMLDVLVVGALRLGKQLSWEAHSRRHLAPGSGTSLHRPT